MYQRSDRIKNPMTTNQGETAPDKKASAADEATKPKYIGFRMYLKRPASTSFSGLPNVLMFVPTFWKSRLCQMVTASAITIVAIPIALRHVSGSKWAIGSHSCKTKIATTAKSQTIGGSSRFRILILQMFVESSGVRPCAAGSYWRSSVLRVSGAQGCE